MLTGELLGDNRERIILACRSDRKFYKTLLLIVNITVVFIRMIQPSITLSTSILLLPYLHTSTCQEILSTSAANDEKNEPLKIELRYHISPSWCFPNLWYQFNVRYPSWYLCQADIRCIIGQLDYRGFSVQRPRISQHFNFTPQSWLMTILGRQNWHKGLHNSVFIVTQL